MSFNVRITTQESVARGREGGLAPAAFDQWKAVLVSANTQRIGNAVDVVKPRSDQCDLKDSPIIKACRAQTRVIRRRDSRCVFRHLHHVIKHYTILLADRRGLIVLFQRPDQFAI